MFIGIEARTVRVNSKVYWRLAPVITGNSKQRMYLGAACVVVAFILSVTLLRACTEQQPAEPTTTQPTTYGRW